MMLNTTFVIPPIWEKVKPIVSSAQKSNIHRKRMKAFSHPEGERLILLENRELREYLDQRQMT
jgi:hypothetical protein